jgi:DNA repair exonuclease SbcCD nuclease subunit
VEEKLLIVGDCHAVSSELDDCKALIDLCVETVQGYDIPHVVFLGDQHHNHSILDSRCLDFWTDVFTNKFRRVTALVGNHDGVSPTSIVPHSMIAHKGIKNVDIVDEPTVVTGIGGSKIFCAMPYYYDPVEFVLAATKLKEANPDIDLLFCHQTFAGANNGQGFYDKDGVDLDDVPFAKIVSGHIHNSMKIGKVWYPGSPRYKTLTDALVKDKSIYILDGKKVKAISTSTHCIKILRFNDKPDQPLELDTEPNAKTDIRIDIYGTPERIQERILLFKAKYNARCRGFPITERKTRVSESDGINVAFGKFAANFAPPNGTATAELLRIINERAVL